MNTKVKKGIFWGGIIASMILVMNVFHYLFGGLNALAYGPHGHEPRGMDVRGGFGPHHMIGHHPSGFSWMGFLLLLIIGLAVLVLVVKWLRRNSKAAAMQQFIDTSLMSSYKPLSNQRSNVLDQWEENLVNKKENV
ncbi:hypothetical protein [Peribacillus asahii]|uniref:hypothetical protein n=1 Tax=Peribacillus asahii TaxID=228899 RepID=UPI00207ADED6|nr:hypothetical protein [Peribacillus asahii]USK58950.1 hypothetical protein LIT37_17285 [Peribacillus asahii]